MDKQNVAVLRKILYAVESGDQIYGRQDYSCFAGVGANCDNETAITIGAGQWYANEAKELLYRNYSRTWIQRTWKPIYC